MGLFDFLTKSRNKSKSVAKDRLKLVLIHDRTNISPKFLEMIKNDMVDAVSKYMVIDEDELDIQFTRTRRESDNSPIPALVANIPILKMKDKEINKE